MAHFRGLVDEQAKLEFALTVLHNSNSPEEAEKIFKEGRDGKVLSEEALASFEKRAKELAPLLDCVEDEEKIRKVEAFRDDLLKECGVGV